MAKLRIDLFSDTITRPTAAMRRFMTDAEVGDEQKFEDPTTLRLQDRVAELLGKEAALFVISGTMCNQISFAVHCRPGDEVVLDETAHPVHAEAGGAAAIAGAQIRTLSGRRGVYSAAQLAEAIRPVWRLAPLSRVVSVEQTANLAGGTIWRLEAIREVTTLARQHGLLCHMDGARLLNAAVATGIPAAEFARPFDSVWIDLSKGLGCPVGAVLAGSKAFIQEAWRWKQRLGGAMRQSGMLAAAGLYALDHHVARLAEDHAHAQRFAQLVTGTPGIGLDPAHVETNIVVMDVNGPKLDAASLLARLLEQGVRLSPVGAAKVRAVTHLDVTRAQVEEAAAIVRQVCTESSR